jgi:hypothetical protein
MDKHGGYPMSDTSFEKSLINWLGVDSMQNTDDPAEFATLLDIIANVTLSDIAEDAVCELLLHISKNNDYARELLFRRVIGQQMVDQETYIAEMQTRFAKALYRTGELSEWVTDMFPEAKPFELNASHSPRIYIGALLSSIENGDRPFADSFFSWETLITFAEQYTPENCSPFDSDVYFANLKGAKAKFDEQLERVA